MARGSKQPRRARRICLREQRDQKSNTDHYDRGRADIPKSDGVDPEDEKTAPIYLYHGARHIGEIVAAVMRSALT